MWQIFVSQNMSQMFVYKNSRQYVYTTQIYVSHFFLLHLYENGCVQTTKKKIKIIQAIKTDLSILACCEIAFNKEQSSIPFPSIILVKINATWRRNSPLFIFLWNQETKHQTAQCLTEKQRVFMNQGNLYQSKILGVHKKDREKIQQMKRKSRSDQVTTGNVNLISETHGIMISIKDHIEFYDSICSSGFVECQVNGAGVIFITLFSICIQYSIILPFIDESIH